MMTILLNARTDSVEHITVATLGPSGTSSEYAAKYFCRWAEMNNIAQKSYVLLSETYELARENIANGEANILVVANAYQGINTFYMDNSLQLSAAFVLDTPLYGLAVKHPMVPGEIVVASHPAPIPLLDELMPTNYSVAKLALKDSTSSAAKAVAEGEVDVALTTELAAKIHGLTFISNVRSIQMLWSAFILKRSSGVNHWHQDLEYQE